eukprot:3818156-Pleurochrysis_carterae.AAC.3
MGMLTAAGAASHHLECLPVRQLRVFGLHFGHFSLHKDIVGREGARWRIGIFLGLALARALA